jgi:DivIVA domain-containing protein
MALTPEDVVNKRFNPTKFREGYDQDEVDDFLDEVVVELRRLNQENEELRQRLVASENRIQELQRAAAQAQAQPAPAQPAPEPAVAAAPAPAPAFAPQPPAFDANAMDPGNTNNLLQLARRLHEEHVREGMEKRDALIAEGHATAARLVSEAEQTQRERLAAIEQERSALEQQRAELEREVEELQIFEREYRAKLKAYIEGQLRELEANNALTAGGSPNPELTSGPSTQAPTGAPAPSGPTTAAPTGNPGVAPSGPTTAAPTGQPQYQPAGWGGGQPSGYPAYPQPTEYPGFGSGS